VFFRVQILRPVSLLLFVRAQDIAKSFISKKAQDIAKSF